MVLIVALRRYFLLFFFFLGGGGIMLREQSPLGLAPLLGAWLRGDFSGPFFWPYFINNIPPVKTHW
jgi:hypothetical protein